MRSRREAKREEEKFAFQRTKRSGACVAPKVVHLCKFECQRNVAGKSPLDTKNAVVRGQDGERTLSIRPGRIAIRLRSMSGLNVPIDTRLIHQP